LERGDNERGVKKYVRDWLRETGYSPEEVKACEICGKQDYVINFELHHKIFKSQGGTDDTENLQMLCRGCHYKIHNQ